MHIDDFDYDLPESFIAQTPVEPRDSSRLMLLDRAQQRITHHVFRDITDKIQSGDVLVMNTTRVIPARVEGYRADTGGRLELLLLRDLGSNQWRALVGGKRAGQGMPIAFKHSQITGHVAEVLDGSERVIQFSAPVNDLLAQQGKTPLPPYIHTRLEDDERYQTIYNREQGSAAAPTAGLHFTEALFDRLRAKGVLFADCTLHIGLDTFQPVKVERIENHKIHSEYAQLTEENAAIINHARQSGGRVIAVGTTTARTLETAAILSAGGDPADPDSLGDALPTQPVTAFAQDTRLFIYPGYRWRAVDALITNFHLPKSTLLMMISSFAGRDFVLQAYETAKQEGYRFFSFGDAMLII